MPIGEELFFRGYALTAWMRDLGERSASDPLDGLLRACPHRHPDLDPFVGGAKQATLVVLVIAPVGLVLGWLFLRRGLVAAIAGHAAFNLVGVLGLLIAQRAS